MRFSKAFVALSAPFLLTSAAPAYKRVANPVDALVVKFALALNQLESAFYQQALAKFKPADFLAAGFSAAQVPLEQYTTISNDESAHIAFLQDALKAIGDVPVAGCKFDFSSVLGDVTTMAAVSRVLENVGVSAFIGAASLLTDKNILGAAASIVSIESRHSTIANTLNGGASIPSAFDMGLTPSSVLALAGGFISGCDFGIPANPPLTITSKGTTVGSQLTFTSPGIDAAKAAGQTQLACQMLTGGDVISQSFPLDNCVVPSNITGPTYIYVTNSSQPLTSNLKDQCAGCIIAGPTLAFIDTEVQALSSLTRTGTPGKAIAADPAAGTPSGSTPGSTAPGTTAPGSTTPGSTTPGTSASGSTGPAASGSASSGSSATSAGGAIPTGSAQQDNSKAAGGSAPGLSAFDGKVVVVGSFTIPKDPAAPAAPPASSASGAAASTSGGALVLPSGGPALSPAPSST